MDVALLDAVVLEDDELAVLVDDEVLELDDEEDVLVGVVPSFLAWTRASTNSLFSRNVRVEIPYDSNSCLMAATLMPETSFSISVSAVLYSLNCLFCPW